MRRLFQAVAAVLVAVALVNVLDQVLPEGAGWLVDVGMMVAGMVAFMVLEDRSTRRGQ